VSLPVPTTADLNTQIVSQIGAQLGQSIPILPKAFINVLAKVLAGVFILLFKYAGWMFLQMFVAYASDRETTVNGRKLVPLTELGRLFGVGDPEPATRAELNVTVTVLNQVGSLNSGQQLVRTESGFVYIVLAAVALNAPTITVRVRAISSPNLGDGSGSAGNLQPGDIIEFANTPAGVGTKAVVLSQAATAADAETTDRYRGRVLSKVQKRPQGGAYSDYVEWGTDVLGIINIYPYAGEDEGGSGPGQVDIYAEADPVSSGSPDGFPTAPQLALVLDSINLNGTSGKASRRPVNAAPNVRSITRETFDAEIAGLQPDTPETRAQIQDGLVEYMLSREPFIVGLTSLPRNDRITQSAVSGIVDTIASAAGATVTKVTLLHGGNPITAFTLNHGQKSKFGAPSYL
jgi:uncharacterized phage protein gp47/JayE